MGTYDVDLQGEEGVTMTFDWRQKWLLFLCFYCLGIEAFTTPDPFQKDVKVEDPSGSKKVQNNQTKGILMDKIQEHFSTAAESVITFVSVSVVGCVITLSVYSWKKFKPGSWRMPVPYQYSVLRQFDNDPDDDVVDPEHSLNMMVEDTSSDEEEIIDNANQSSTSSKTIGAIDTNPPDANAPATLPVSITETAEASIKNLKTGRRSGSSNLLGDESDKSSRHSSINDEVFANNGSIIANGGSQQDMLNDLFNRST